jgi:hypothetical protein
MTTPNCKSSRTPARGKLETISLPGGPEIRGPPLGHTAVCIEWPMIPDSRPKAPFQYQVVLGSEPRPETIIAGRCAQLEAMPPVACACSHGCNAAVNHRGIESYASVAEMGGGMGEGPFALTYQDRPRAGLFDVHVCLDAHCTRLFLHVLWLSVPVRAPPPPSLRTQLCAV